MFATSKCLLLLRDLVFVFVLYSECGVLWHKLCKAKMCEKTVLVSLMFVCCVFSLSLSPLSHSLSPLPQVWSVSVNGTGGKVVSVSDDKSLIIYSCPF